MVRAQRERCSDIPDGLWGDPDDIACSNGDQQGTLYGAGNAMFAGAVGGDPMGPEMLCLLVQQGVPIYGADDYASCRRSCGRG